MNTPIIARDLTKEAPHSPRERLAGFAIAHPQMNSTFDWLEADDRETFRRKSRRHFLL